MTLQFIPNNSLLECQKCLFICGKCCRFSPFFRTKEQLTTKQWHHITRTPKNIVVYFFSRRINTVFWEQIMPVCSTHHSLPLDYEVINEAVSHSSTVNLQEPKLHSQTQETAREERKMTLSLNATRLKWQTLIHSHEYLWQISYIPQRKQFLLKFPSIKNVDNIV